MDLRKLRLRCLELRKGPEDFVTVKPYGLCNVGDVIGDVTVDVDTSRSEHTWLLTILGTHADKHMIIKRWIKAFHLEGRGVVPMRLEIRHDDKLTLYSDDNTGIVLTLGDDNVYLVKSSTRLPCPCCEDSDGKVRSFMRTTCYSDKFTGIRVPRQLAFDPVDIDHCLENKDNILSLAYHILREGSFPDPMPTTLYFADLVAVYIVITAYPEQVSRLVDMRSTVLGFRFRPDNAMSSMGCFFLGWMGHLIKPQTAASDYQYVWSFHKQTRPDLPAG